METEHSHEDEITNSVYVYKNFIVFAFIYIGIFLWKKIQNKVKDKLVSQNIFIKNKNLSSEYILRFIEIIRALSDNAKDITLLFNIIEEHKSKCNGEDDCNNNKISIRKVYSHLAHNYHMNYANRKDTKTHNTFYLKTFYEILLFGENEICNLIHSIGINKKLNNNLEVIFLHCNYVFFYTQNVTLALYLIQEYSHLIKDMPLVYMIYFFSLKKEILNDIELKSFDQIDPNKLIPVKFINFLSYYKVICSIKKNLLNCTDNLQNILLMKYSFLDNKTNVAIKRTQITKKVEMIFNKSLAITESLNKIERLLKDNYSEEKLKNPEVCYLLTNFYILISKKTPNHLQSYFVNLEYYDTVTSYNTSFKEVNFIYPMIFSANTNHIIYFSTQLAKILKYNQKDLIGNDFHILIPSIFAEQHTLTMKKYFFIKQSFNVERPIFLLDKEKYYYKVNLHGGLLPSLENKLFVINDLDIKNQFNKRYLFILDMETNIIAMTHNFQEKYQITYEMIKKLNITFCSLFGFSYEHFIKDFKSKISAINKINLTGIKDLVPLEHSFLNNKYAIYYDDFALPKKDVTVKKIRCKVIMKSTVKKIKSQIIEHEYDNGWLDNIHFLEDLIDSETIMNPKTAFEVSIQLHNIGSCGYFYVKIYDKDEDYQFDHKKSSMSGSFYDVQTPLNDSKGNIDDADINFLDKASKANLQLLTSSANRHLNILNTSSTNNNTNSSFMNYSLINTKNQLLSQSNISYKLLKKPIRKIETVSSLTNEIIVIKEPNIKLLLLVLYITLILIFILFSIYIFSIVYKNSSFNTLEDLLALTQITVKLKEYVLDTSLSVTSGCLIADGIVPTTVDGFEFNVDSVKFLLALASKNFFTQLTSLLFYISTYSSLGFIQDLTDYLYIKQNYTALNDDYTTYSYESDLYTELFYFHYSTIILNEESSFTTCHIKKFYIDKDYTGRMNNSTKREEKLMYYVSTNVIEHFMKYLSLMVIQADIFLDKHFESYKRGMEMINISLLVIGILICTGFLLVIIIKKNKIAFLLNVFLRKNSKSKLFEKKIKDFHNLLLNLDEDTYYTFELSKTTAQKKSTKNIRITKQFINVQSDLVGKPNWAKRSSLFQPSVKPKQEKICNFNNKPIEHTDTSTENIFKLKLSIFFFSNICIFYFLINFFIIIHATLLVLNVLFDNDFIHQLRFAKRLGYYFMERTPSNNEILLYHRISILHNNHLYIEFPSKNYKSFLQNLYISDDEIDTSNDSRYLILGDSMASFLYFRLFKLFSLISRYERLGGNSAFIERNKFSLETNKKSGACEAYSQRYVSLNLKESPYFNNTHILNACLKLAGGIADNGSTNSRKNYISYLMDEYIDFIKEEGKGDIIKYLSSHLYLVVLYQRIFIYNTSWLVTTKLLGIDFKNLFHKIHSTEVIMQILEIITSAIICSFFYLFIIVSLTRKILNFENIVNRINYVID